MNNAEILVGDCLEVLPKLPECSVQCVVTSPPYYGLRDYGTAQWEGGSPECDHRQSAERRQIPHGDGRPMETDSYAQERHLIPGAGAMYREVCGKCGARRVDRQLGLEATPEQYVAKLVAVFREVRRVLRDDGTLWLNLGDSYYNYRTGYNGAMNGQSVHNGEDRGKNFENPRRANKLDGLKEKDLIGIPWRVAFALQADGWYLRSDIIWAKPNPMPESVRDRPTKAHEYVFLLTKSARYYYDSEAIAEPFNYPERTYNGDTSNHKTAHLAEIGNRSTTGLHDGRTQYGDPARGRNRRTVWTIATEPYPEAHFATYPTKLVEPCILAGTSERGCCPNCSAPWQRIVKHGEVICVGGSSNPDRAKMVLTESGPMNRTSADGNNASQYANQWVQREHNTVGWRPTCCCDAGEPVPCVVLDPFAGSGTTGAVAMRHNRRFIGIELNPDYLPLIEKRLHGVQSVLL